MTDACDEMAQLWKKYTQMRQKLVAVPVQQAKQNRRLAGSGPTGGAGVRLSAA